MKSRDGVWECDKMCKGKRDRVIEWVKKERKSERDDVGTCVGKIEPMC